MNYDASGNLAGYRYDAASRITLAEGVCYLYDAEGRRVAKGTSLSGNVCENLTNIYVLGAGGEQLSEFDGSGNWKHTNVYGGGKLLATYDALGTHFHLTDWLGTMRAQVSSNGVVDETCIDMPFGDDQNCSGPGVDATEHHFTGKVRDVETGFDYFGARYYASTAGRWMSPDWSATAAPVPYAKLDFPQSLNLYAYVENNPLTMADPDGHCGSSAPIHCGSESDRIADSEAAQEQNQANAAAAGRADATQKAQQQGSTESSDAKEIRGAVKEGIKIGKELTGEAKEAATWYNIMKNDEQNAIDPPSGLSSESRYFDAMAEYAHQQANYHGVRAGLTLTQIQQGAFSQPFGWFVKVYFQLTTPGIQQQMLKMVEVSRQTMVEAHEAYVAEVTALHGSSQ